MANISQTRLSYPVGKFEFIKEGDALFLRDRTIDGEQDNETNLANLHRYIIERIFDQTLTFINNDTDCKRLLTEEVHLSNERLNDNFEDFKNSRQLTEDEAVIFNQVKETFGGVHFTFADKEEKRFFHVPLTLPVDEDSLKERYRLVSRMLLQVTEDPILFHNKDQRALMERYFSFWKWILVGEEIIAGRAGPRDDNMFFIKLAKYTTRKLQPYFKDKIRVEIIYLEFASYPIYYYYFIFGDNT